MAIASTNPATGELIQSFDALTADQIEEKLAAAAAAFRSYRTTTFAERAAWLRARSRHPRRRGRGTGPPRDAGDGQDARVRDRRGRQVREGLPVVRRAHRGHPRRPAASGRRREGVHPARAARSGPRDHAVELPVLAGVPVRRARADDRQRRAAQARVERPAVRAGDRGRPAQGRVPRRHVPDAPDRLEGRRRRSSRTAAFARSRSPAARPRAGPSAPPRAARSSPACWSWAAATRSS